MAGSVRSFPAMASRAANPDVLTRYGKMRLSPLVPIRILSCGRERFL